MAVLQVWALVALAMLATETYATILFPGDVRLLAAPISPINQTQLFEDWSHLTGPSFSLKLFRLVDSLRPSINAIFSPLALKLTLLALASVSNPTQESAINTFLFDRSQPSLLEQNLSEAAENEVHALINVTEALKQLPPAALRDHLSSLLKPIYSNGGDGIYDLCTKFKANSNPGVVANCVGYISTIPFQQRDSSQTLALTRLDEIKLCQAFGIQNYFACVNQFLDKPEAHWADYNPALANFSTADLALQLAEQFHDSNATIGQYHSFIHRLTFLNVNQTTDDWNNMLTWFGMAGFRASDLEEQWNEFNRTALRSLQPAITPSPNTLLNIIQFKHKLTKSFSSIGMYMFTLANSSEIAVEMLYKQDTFAWVNHGVETQTPVDSSHLLVKIPFENAKYSLVLMIPAVNSTISQMMTDITSDQLTFYLKRLQLDEKELRLTIPRFSMSGSLDFGSILQSANLSTIQLTRASPNITDPIEVSGQLKQIVQVTPYGMVESGWNRLRYGYYDWITRSREVEAIRVTRPFVYLFVGRYLDLNIKPAFEVIVAGSYYGPEVQL